MTFSLAGLLVRCRRFVEGAARLSLTAASLACVLAQAPAHAQDASADQVRVTDPYIEIRTGHGRGFPIFHVAAKDELIQLELRHTDWYRVRTADGKVGWVDRRQLQTTLTAAGEKTTFRDIALDDYLASKADFGMAWGRFKSEPMLKLWTGYKLGKNFSVEGTLGQVQGVFSGTTVMHINLLAQPMADKRLSPFFGIGAGKFKNIPNSSLVNATTTDADLANAMVGLRYHLTDRFVLRTDYTFYTVYINGTRTSQYRAYTAGLSFFF